MPRDANGNYILPAGNPVTSGTLITSTWANDTMPDLGAEVADSLSRSGKGGMLAAFQGIDGTLATPGIAFLNEPGSGLHRAGPGDVRAQVLGDTSLYLVQGGAYGNINGTRLGKLSIDGSFEALIASIGSTPTTLILYPETWPVTAATTVPSTIELVPILGALIQPASGIDVAINGVIHASSTQRVFDVSLGGTVTGPANETIFAEWWGTVHDGATLDDAAVSGFLANINGKTAVLGPGVHLLSTVMTHAPSDCKLIGTPGQTELRNNGSTVSVIEFQATSNVEVYGVRFTNPLVRATYTVKGIFVVGYQANIKNFKITNCYFNNPSNNCDALDILPNVNTTDTNTCDGVTIEDNEFDTPLRNGILVMNRNTSLATQERHKLMQRVFVRRNLFKNSGDPASANGIGCSLDGTGLNFAMDHNVIDNQRGLIGLENTGFRGGSISFNTFQNCVTANISGIACSMSPIDNSDVSRGVVIQGNMTVGPQDLQHYIANVKGGVTVSGNYFEANGSQNFCFLVSNCDDCVVRDNTFRLLTAVPKNAIHCRAVAGGVCKRNRFIDNITDTGTGGQGNILFTGAGCEDNVVTRGIIKRGTGNYILESGGAINNIGRNLSTEPTAFSLDYFLETFSADADMTVSAQVYSANVFRVANSALTTGRNVIMPPIRGSYQVINGTGFTLTFKASTGTGVAVAAGLGATIAFDGTNFIRLTADSALT